MHSKAHLLAPQSPVTLPPGIIDTTVPACAAISAAVIFPCAEAALVPRPLRHFQATALLRLADGTLWLLSLPSAGWTAGRLASAAAVLAAQAGRAANPHDLEQQVRAVLGLTSARLQPPRLDAVEPRQWGLTETVRALVNRGGSSPLPGFLHQSQDRKQRQRSELRAVEATVCDALDAALQELVRGLDPEARATAASDGRIDVARYNYLVYAPCRRYRLQFAATFPGLLQTMVAAAPGKLGAELRDVVDAGRPLIKTLASAWAVRSGVVRYLMHTPPDLLGQQWIANIKALACVLDALRPQDLPTLDAEDWDRFNARVVVGQCLFRRPVWRSPAALAWPRACTHHLKRGSAGRRARWLPDRTALDRIGGFRDALTATLQRPGNPSRPRTSSSDRSPEPAPIRWSSKSTPRVRMPRRLPIANGQ